MTDPWADLRGEAPKARVMSPARVVHFEGGELGAAIASIEERALKQAQRQREYRERLRKRRNRCG